jgi:membrane protein required for colicin V production
VNWVDLAVLGVVALSALLAFMRGFVREVLGIGAWVGAAVFSVVAFPYVAPKFHEWLGDPSVADPAAYVAMFVAALIALSLLTGAIGAAVRMSMLGGIDRTLGVVFGIARGAVLVIFAYIAGGTLIAIDRWPEPVQQARLLPYAYQGAVWAVGLLPDEYRPNVPKPPPGRETRAADLLHALPQGRARP